MQYKDQHGTWVRGATRFTDAAGIGTRKGQNWMQVTPTMRRKSRPTEKLAILCKKVSILATLLYFVWVRKARCSDTQSDMLVIGTPTMVENIWLRSATACL